MTSLVPRPALLKAHHLLGISDLSPLEIPALLDLAETYVEVNRAADKRKPVLAGLTQVNLFFEEIGRAHV